MTTDTPVARRRRMKEAAVTAAVRHARSLGLRVDDPVVLHDLFSVRVHLRPAPVVARVCTWISTLRTGTGSLERELAVAEYLQRSGVPVVPPSAELPAGPHTEDGLHISYWTYVPPAADRAATPADCVAMLPDLHAALAGFPGSLPDIGTTVDLPRWLGQLDPGSTSQAELDLLRDAARRLRPLLEPDPSWQPLHGDVHPGNLLAGEAGLLWTDFEEVCRGPAEWDLASIGDEEAVAVLHPNPDRLAGCGRLRALQVALCLINLRHPFTDLAGWEDGIAFTLRRLG